MPTPIHKVPPPSRSNYIITQLEGERVTLPGSKGVFRILASAEQTDGKLSVFTGGSVLADAPGLHYHKKAHDVFLCTKGYLNIIAGDKCRVLGPGDFAYVPPNVIHRPLLLGPHTEMLGVVVPGDWVDFFRYVGEPFNGVIVPENDERDLMAMTIQKMKAATKDYDVYFVPDFQPPEVGDWQDDENVLPTGDPQPYFLRANTGPRWIAGGVLSRPFITTHQSAGLFSISSIESSADYGPSVFSNYVAFPNVDHCICVQEGALRVNLKGDTEWATLHEGETVLIAAGQSFKLEFASKFVRVWSCTDGPGIEELVQEAGAPFKGFVIPDQPPKLDESKLRSAVEKVGVVWG